jgi:hypothetical protein
MECSLSEFEEGGGWMGAWVGGLVLRKVKTRLKTQNKKGLTFICSPTFFSGQKRAPPTNKNPLWVEGSVAGVAKSRKPISQIKSLGHSLSLLIKERRRFHRLPSTYTTFWLDGSLTFHKQTFFPSQNLLQICSLSLSHTHTHTQNSSSFLQNSNTKFNWKPQSWWRRRDWTIDCGDGGNKSTKLTLYFYWSHVLHPL